MSNEQLSLNLHEIYTAVHPTQDPRLNLVANISGTRLYNVGYGWGRVWSVFYAIWATLFSYRLKYRKLFEALRKTSEAFQKESTEISKIYKTYKENLSAQIDDLANQNPKDYARTRWLITHWNDSTKSFSSLLFQQTHRKLMTLQHILARFDKETSKKSEPFHLDPWTPKIHQCQRLINVERALDTQTPHHIIGKLAGKKNLKREEEELLKVWIEKLIHARHRISVNQLHKGLKYLINYMAKKHCGPRQSKPDLKWLETMLAQRGCSTFRETDHKLIAWRKSLKPGDTIRCNGKRYVLGTQISPTKESNDNNVVYSVQGREDIVILIGKNRAILGIKQVIAKESSWGIRPVVWRHLDDSGTCVVLEKLSQPADAVKWTSTTDLKETDKIKATPFVNQIKWLLDKQLTPQDFSPKNLMFDAKGTLKYSKISLPGPFDYLKLVSFCLGCARNHPVVFKHLMEASGLSTHPYAAYYCEVAKNTLAGVDTKPEDLAAFQRYQISDPLAIDQAIKLKKDLLFAENRIMQKILRKYRIEDPLALSKEVKKTLLSEHQKSGTLCLLWHRLRTTVIQSILAKHKFKKKNE